MLRDRILFVRSWIFFPQKLKRLRLLWTEISRDREISCKKSEMSCESHWEENVSLADGNKWRPYNLIQSPSNLIVPFFHRTHVRRNLARTKQPVKLVLQTKDIVVCVLLVSKEITARLVILERAWAGRKEKAGERGHYPIWINLSVDFKSQQVMWQRGSYYTLIGKNNVFKTM